MTTQTFIIAILAFLFILLAVAVAFLWRRFGIFFKGKKAVDLEGHINDLTNQVKKIEAEKEKLNQEVAILEEKAKQCLRGIATIRFNPFADGGSNQSFAVALLNENGDGVVLSSLYAREKTAVYAKPILKLGSEYELSTEEKQAIKKAKL